MSGTTTSMRHLLIRGRVQGVGFRAWTERRARALGLGGWVRNCRDGAVEVVFVGPADRVAEMTEACRRGPASSRVDSVEEREARADDLALGRPNETFSVLSTG